MNELANLWNWYSPVTLVAGALLLAYAVAFRKASWSRFMALGGALGLLELTYISPLGTLADGYSFSAHMMQHLILLLLVPLFLTLSLPVDTLNRWFAGARANTMGRCLTMPLLGCIAGVGTMWLWHVPSLCSASTENVAIGAVRDTSLLLAGLLFWQPIYSPVVRYRLPPLSGIIYLFTSCLGCTLLGIYITFTTVTVCPSFAEATGRQDIFYLLYDVGLTPAVEQHLGGLLMWVPPCMLYVLASISLLVRWYSNGEEMEGTA